MTSKEAVIKTADQIIEKNPKRICLTGGKFGLKLLYEMSLIHFSPSNKSFFVTDERLDCPKEEQNFESLHHVLKDFKNFDSKNFFRFIQVKDPNLSYKGMINELDQIFDLTILSLGEDGHLAGHFNNSISLKDKRFCYTDDAPKEPKSRISFSVDYLMRSKEVILAIFGRHKKKAMIELYKGKGLHSKIIKSSNLRVLTDIKI